MDILTQLQTLAELQDEHDALLTAQAEAIPQRLRTELARIGKRFVCDLDRVTTAIDLLEMQVKAAVITHGASVKGERLQAVYIKGRTHWNGDMLAGYAANHPEIWAFRKVAAATVTLRKVVQKAEAV